MLHFFGTPCSLDFFVSYLQYGMCSAEKSHSLKLGTSNFPLSVVLDLSLILLSFWSLKNEQSHKSAIFSCTKPKWAKKDENMYEVYRKYKKNGFRNTLKMTKMCLLWGTVPPPLTVSLTVKYPCFFLSSLRRGAGRECSCLNIPIGGDG